MPNKAGPDVVDRRRIPHDAHGRFWIEISGVNPVEVDRFRPCLVAFLVFDAQRNAAFAGSGFVVAGASDFVMVLSAKHVFDHVSALQRPATSYRSPSPFVAEKLKKPTITPGTLHAVWMDSERAEMLNVVHMGYNETLDVGCCILMPQNGNILAPAVPIDTSVPEVGEVVHMLSLDGLWAEEKIPPVDRSGKGQLLEVSRAVSIRIGTVTGVHQSGYRQYKWPCFTTSIPANPGMSGGLVYRPRDGQTIAACGVVCADASSEEARGDNYHCGESIVASTWPSLALPVPTELRNGSSMIPILELMRRGAMPLAVGGIDGIDVVLDHAGNGSIRRLP